MIFDFRLSFLRFYHFRILPEPGKRNKMAALENILDEVRRFLLKENDSYEDPLVVIKNRYPNLRGCSLRSIKRFCSYHGIKKRMSVADGAVDINACTLVPSVFLRSRKTEFELLVSFSVYPRQRKTEFEIPFSFFVFRFPTTLKMEFELLFPFLVFPRLWTTKF